MAEKEELRDVRTAFDAIDSASLHSYYAKSWALVIGITEYGKHGRLPNARKDAEDFASLLEKKFSFDNITLLVDEQATRDAIMEKLRDDLPNQVDNKDRLIFFFAGHGTSKDLKRGGKYGYIIPHNAREKFADYIDMEELRRACGCIRAKHILIILDCCFSGVAAIAARNKANDAEYQRLDNQLLQKFTRKNAWQILTAGQSDELVAESGPCPGHSAFTCALLQGLDERADLDKNGLITASEIACYVSNRVSEETSRGCAKGQSTFFNYISGSDQGNFVFELSGRRDGGGTEPAKSYVFSWTKIPGTDVERIWEIIREKFVLKVEEPNTDILYLLENVCIECGFPPTVNYGILAIEDGKKRMEVARKLNHAEIYIKNNILKILIESLRNSDSKNQTACGHPTLKDGVCFGPHALTPGFMESRNRRVFVALIPWTRTIESLLSVSPEIPQCSA